MYLRAKYTKYKMAKTKFSIWRYIICEICKKNGSNRPFLASRVADTIFPPPIEGHHRQLDNQCKDPMDNNKDCRVGQLTSGEEVFKPCIQRFHLVSTYFKCISEDVQNSLTFMDFGEGVDQPSWEYFHLPGVPYIQSPCPHNQSVKFAMEKT